MRKKIILAIALIVSLLIPNNASAKYFDDVKVSDWFFDVVSELTNQGIIQGYQDNTFKPNRKVSYAEFLTLLNNALGEKQEPDNKNPREWYNPTLKELKSKGVISEEITNPNGDITRNEMVKFLSLGIEKLKHETPNTTRPTAIKDFDNVPKEYQKFVAHVVNAGYIVGDQHSNFNGDRLLTRAETATIIKAITMDPIVVLEKPVIQANGYPPMEGKDKFGKPYKIPQVIVDKYPENRNPKLSGENGYQPIVNPDMLYEYGQKYLNLVQKRVEETIEAQKQPGYWEREIFNLEGYDRWAPSLLDRNMKSDLDGERMKEDLRKRGFKPFGEGVDFENMTEEELKEYL